MWRSTWQPCVRLMAARGPSSRLGSPTRPARFMSGQADSLTGTPTACKAPMIGVREASDTLDLIDQLLWALGPADSGEAGFVFFDLDETLITRDTCLVDGLGSTSALMARLEAKLGPSSETLRVIRQEMERDYYNADPRLVDPLLARVIRALKIQGHSVFGLTSNALDPVHAPRILETLAKYKIRFSAPDVRGELPRSGALMVDHPVSRGIIFGDNQQAVSHDKGEIIAEYVGLLLHNARRAVSEHVGAKTAGDAAGGGLSEPGGVKVGDGESSGGRTALAGSLSPKRPRKCVLVDNTSKKCERAAETFARHAAAAGGGLELHTLHFTEAENMVDSPEALRQLRIILARLKERGLIGVDLIAEDILVTPVGGVRRGAGYEVKAAAAAACVPDGKSGRGG
ncbi:unnamed protein product [Ectocarpus sp. 4 AP-2014]